MQVLTNYACTDDQPALQMTREELLDTYDSLVRGNGVPVLVQEAILEAVQAHFRRSI